MQFQQCFVAFLDILGFREMVKDQQRVTQAITFIQSAIANGISQGSHGIFPNDPIHQMSLSDSIVFSIPTGASLYEHYKRLRFLLHAVQKFQQLCAINDIWIRGGVSWGQLSTGQNVVGEGLVKAFEIEQSARFPRVVIDPRILPELFTPLNGPKSRQELIKEINLSFGVQNYSGEFLFSKEKHLAQPFQGYLQDDVPLFVHYFHNLYSQDFTENQRQKICENISKWVYKTKSTEIYSKYRWVIDYAYAVSPTESHETNFIKDLLRL
ncbi:MAG: hypothetical protein ACK5P6_06690 [Pseudobdellovibrionaceae bacterium]